MKNKKEIIEKVNDSSIKLKEKTSDIKESFIDSKNRNDDFKLQFFSSLKIELKICYNINEW